MQILNNFIFIGRSIISYMKRILNIKTFHTKVGEIEKFENIDFSYLFEHIKKLSKNEIIQYM